MNNNFSSGRWQIIIRQTSEPNLWFLICTTLFRKALEDEKQSLCLDSSHWICRETRWAEASALIEKKRNLWSALISDSGRTETVMSSTPGSCSRATGLSEKTAFYWHLLIRIQKRRHRDFCDINTFLGGHKKFMLQYLHAGFTQV